MSTTVGSARQTWRKIKRKVIKPTVKRLDMELDNLRSGEFVRYREWVMSHVGKLPLNGFVVAPFHQYFVEPDLCYQQGPTDIKQKLPRPLRNDRHSLVEFLQTRKIQKHKLLLTGEPGMGKTTLLRHLAWQTAVNGLGDPLERLPFLLVAAPMAATLLRHPERTLAQLVEEQLQLAGFEPEPGWLDEQIANGRCLLLVDGLDEIVQPEAWTVLLSWLDEQATQHKRNLFMATTRPYIGNSDLLAAWTVLALQPFDKGQQAAFLRRWGLADDERWLEQLADLAERPFLLTLLAQLHQQERPLPTTQYALFSEFCTQQLVDGWQYDPVSQVLDAHLRRFTLAQVAYEMTRARKLYLTDDELTRLVGEQVGWMVESGLMVRTAVGLIRFTHTLLQSYLTAVFIRTNNQEKKLWPHLDDRWWHDVIRFYAQEHAAERLIAQCLTTTQPTIERLHLVYNTLQRVDDISPKLLESIPRLLWHNSNENNSLQQRLVAELLLLTRFERADLPAVEAGVMVTHAEYQLFVDAMQAHGRHSQPDHWLAYQYPKGQAMRPVVGTRSVDAQSFCDWLNERTHGLQFRLPFSGELNGRLYAQVGNQKGVAYWVNSSDSIHLELLTAPLPAAEVLERQLARDLFRAHGPANKCGFRFPEEVPLIIDHTRATCLNLPEIILPEFDVELLRAMSVIDSYDVLDHVGTQANDPPEWKLVPGMINGRLEQLAELLATILQIPVADIHDLIFNLPQTNKLAKQRYLDPQPILARQVLRFYALILAATLQNVWLLQRQYLTLATNVIYRDRVTSWQQAVARRVTIYLDIYTDMVVLDERKAGNLQATEGVCLVGDPSL